jgi:carboxypeptidase C (cathepsin A)
MKRILALTALLTTGIVFTTLFSAQAADPADHDAPAKSRVGKEKYFKPESTNSTGTVTFPSGPVDYEAVAGTLVVHPKGWDDAAVPDDKESDSESKDSDKANPTAEASMFYAAYFKHGADAAQRPITFFFNGGPGSSTVWLHMGAFGPRRVVTVDGSHTPAAPYQVVNNEYSLLDVSDLVFIDAPGTGFSRIAGKDKEKSFYGVDPDAHAFAEFISAFLRK